MSVSKLFICDHCDVEGKIVIKTKDITKHDIVCCPICGASIWDEDDELDDE